MQPIPLRVLAFTHKSTPLKELNRFFVADDRRVERLSALRDVLGLKELLYIATCNRIEFVFVADANCDEDFIRRFFRSFCPGASTDEIDFAARHATVFEGVAALEHIYRVASSLDSLVVGEREIITQVRKSYDECKAAGLTGDLIRLSVQSTINTAKRVYTETKIAANPVSVVSLAERQLRQHKLPKHARILIVGAGETNTNLCKYLVKQGFSDFVIFNRTPENGEGLARMLNADKARATAFPLTALATHDRGFDLIVTCTGSSQAVITPELYRSLLAGEKGAKVLVDLAVPADIHPEVIRANQVHHIGMDELKAVAEKNLSGRQAELKHAEQIIAEQLEDFDRLLRTRNLELKMREVPDKFREIRERALNEVFARDIESMDETSKAIMGKVIDYMEKKYISVPMVMAKDILLDNR